MNIRENEKLLELVSVLMNTQSQEDMLNLLEDLCTIKELNDLSERFYIAKLLYDNKTYEEVSVATKASTATIARVNKALLYGKNGYQTALKKI